MTRLHRNYTEAGVVQSTMKFKSLKYVDISGL